MAEDMLINFAGSDDGRR